MSTRFEDLSDQDRTWLEDYVDGRLSPEDFDAFQERVASDAPLRAAVRRYLAMDGYLRELEGANDDPAATPWLQTENAPQAPDTAPTPRRRIPSMIPVAAAAAIAFLLGLAFMRLQPPPSETAQAETRSPQAAEGFAVMHRAHGATWADEQGEKAPGDTLGDEKLHLISGTVEIRFFSGADMTLEGPAEITLVSAWEANCHSGSVRMRVPPAARGFRLQTPSSEIIDLGTEFGLEVREGAAHVEVFDGEIAVRHRSEKERRITEGKAWDLPDSEEASPSEPGRVRFPSLAPLESDFANQQESAFNRWQRHKERLAADPRVIAYYTFDRDNTEAPVRDLSRPEDGEHDGAVILAETVDGRWKGRKQALEFARPGSRVRVNIPGEFPAFTFVCWARIDSIDSHDRRYNALFMGDGYETGEPHWQIRDDGKLMLSVMVDDTRPNPKAANDAGFHRVYYSPPFWDVSMSGKWIHLASVFDPANRRVSHYVDGEAISHQEITDEYFIDTLRIGPGEIGNWGLPFRKTPWFAIRHLTGRIDELAIFQTALDDSEVRTLYEGSRSQAR